MTRTVQCLLLLFLGSVSFTYAQTNVQLNIHHKLGGEDFVMNTTATNNLGHSFDFTRLEYYIAELSLIHDGGQETPVTDLYILADAAEETHVELGDFELTNLEAIRFHVGVDEANNHGDPTLWHSSHPLSPQWPSMHWGWTSGYRFVAFEGNSGANMSEIWQIHALEDENYFQTEIEVELTASNDELVIHLDADYIRALENIELDSGPIVHGGYGEAKETLRNFQDYVFTPSGVVSSTSELSLAHQLRVFPNPATAGTVPQFMLETAKIGDTYDAQVTNVQGQMVRHFSGLSAQEVVPLPNLEAGVYFIQFYQAGNLLASQKLVVQ